MGKYLRNKKLITAFLRITLTRVTATFFLFSFLHCFAQGIIQAFLYTIDSEHNTFISTIIQEGQLPPGELAWLTNVDHGYKLQLCHDVPLARTPLPCVTIFDSGQPDVQVPPGYRRSRSTPSDMLLGRSSTGQTDGVEVSLDASGAIDGVDIFVGNQPIIHLNNQCTRVLVYFQQVLKNSKREDFALISVQFWLFAISFIAIMSDSIPHTLAGFSARVLVTGWSTYTIWRTFLREDEFRHLVLNSNSPCNADLLPSYFKSRMAFEVADVILNFNALFLSTYLSWRLLKTYKTISFKHVGAPAKIIHIYKYFMAVLVCLQLSVFLLVTAMALWINQLIFSPVSLMSLHTPIYKALFICTTVLLLPWITMGWYAIRHEIKNLMAGFLVLGFIFTCSWALMFYSLVYQWTFLEWPFLACLTVGSFIVMIASMILGVKSWLYFNQGLSNYLCAEEVLSLSTLEPEVFLNDIEKKDSVSQVVLPTLHHSSH